MEQVSLQNLAQPQIVSTNNMIPQQINNSFYNRKFKGSLKQVI